MELEADGFQDVIGRYLRFDDASTSNGLDQIFQWPNPPVTATGSTPLQPSSTVLEPDASSNPPSDSLGAIEAILMKDDNFDANKVPLEESNEYYDKFVADVLLNSPSIDGNSNAFPDSDKGKFDRSPLTHDADDGPISKKRERQKRNKDAASRLRQRKKEHVKYLEIKSKSLEAENRRLTYWLNYYRAKCLSLQKNNAYQHGHGSLSKP